MHLWGGGYKGPGGQFLKTINKGVKYPLTPGHEVAGYVMSLGEEAFVALEGNISKNEEVLIYPWIGERLCPACMNGEENLCDKPRSLGTYAEGGYAEYVLVCIGTEL
ncbi:MAG: alcohol dehydrogenase catalytic domain-containing protein [Nitrososphaeraceae archaeon]